MQVELLASAYLSALSIGAFGVLGSAATQIVPFIVVGVAVLFGWVQKRLNEEYRSSLQDRIDYLGKTKRRVRHG